jgi:hypothetical protein
MVRAKITLCAALLAPAVLSLCLAAFLNKLKWLHRRDFTEERKDYEAAVDYAACYPDELLVVAMDAMDSAKTCIPHSALNRDAKEASDKVQQPVWFCALTLCIGPT